MITIGAPRIVWINITKQKKKQNFVKKSDITLVMCFQILPVMVIVMIQC